MHFKLKEAFSMYKKCKRCGFEICLSSQDEKATAEDWKYCPKCGFSNKVFKKDLTYK